MDNKSQPEPLPPFEARAEAVLAATFQGLHHLPTPIKKHADVPYWEVLCRDLATFDFDRLTRLVVAAHEHCVRAEVSPCNMTYIRLRLHDRKGREGAMFARHPTIWQALEDLGVSQPGTQTKTE